MERRRTIVSALHDHAIAIAHARMARSAVNIEAVLASFQQWNAKLDLRRKLIAEHIAMPPGQVITIWIQLLLFYNCVLQAGHGARYGITRRPMVRIKLAGA